MVVPGLREVGGDGVTQLPAHALPSRRGCPQAHLAHQDQLPSFPPPLSPKF